MRGLNLRSHENLTNDTLSRLSSNSPGGVLCPKLDRLLWDFCEAGIPLEFFRLFLSPDLNGVRLWTISNPFPLDQLEPLAQMISLLPPSLQNLFFMWGQGRGFFQDTISSFICRRGSSLRNLCTNVLLSEAAIHHLMRLPTLRHWSTYQGPPRAVPTSISLPLEGLYLHSPVALPWLHILASHGKHTAQNSDTPSTSHTNIRETLKFLFCSRVITLESTLLPSITSFRNLIRLRVDTYCSMTGGCIFRLTDGDMGNLATALPRLESLQLGRPCCFNSCNTTITSLLSLSVHCLGLMELETHFNTLTIVSDARRLLDEGIGHDKARCMVSDLPVGHLPTTVRENDIGNVAMGLKVIFPRLKYLRGKDGPLSVPIYEIVD